MKKMHQICLRLFSFAVLALLISSIVSITSKPSSAQSAQVCTSRSYTCSGRGDGIDIFQVDAEAAALSECNSKLTDCQRTKSSECATYCMNQSCIPSVSASSISACNTLKSAKGAIQCTIGVNFPPNSAPNQPKKRFCGITIQGGISMEGYLCASSGSSTVNCNCLEQGRRFE